MHRTRWPVRSLAALAGSMMVTAAQAGPLNSAGIGSIASSPSAARDVTAVASRRCWRQHGVMHCRNRPSIRSSGGYYVRDADKLPFGTSIWWEQMMRENRAGNPGGGGRN